MTRYLNSPFLKYMLGLIELLLIIAFVLKLLGASTAAPFVKGLYLVTDSFAAPFKGMFTDQYIRGGGLLDMTTFSAMMMYAIFVVIPIFLHQKYRPLTPRGPMKKPAPTQESNPNV